MPRKRKYKPGYIKSFLVLVTTLVLLGGYWLWRQYRESPAEAHPIISVRTGLVGEYAAAIRIAKDQGYFAEQNLDVSIDEYASGPAALTALTTGKVDAAVASDFAGVRTILEGQDLKVVANMSTVEAFFMVGRKDRGLAQPSDIAGKRVGITRKTVGEFYLGQFLSFNKVSARDVTIIDLPQSDLIEAAKNGTVDAIVVFEPNAYKARAELGDNAIQWSVQEHQSIYSLLYTSGSFIASQPDVMHRYLRAVLKAEEFLRSRPAAAKEIIAKQVGYDAAYLEYIWPRFMFSMSLDEELLINMGDEARWVIENKLTAATVVPNYFQVLYLDALQAVKPAAVTVIH